MGDRLGTPLRLFRWADDISPTVVVAVTARQGDRNAERGAAEMLLLFFLTNSVVAVQVRAFL